eukprot:670830-Pyramimonas_sp.AAC.1
MAKSSRFCTCKSIFTVAGALSIYSAFFMDTLKTSPEVTSHFSWLPGGLQLPACARSRPWKRRTPQSPRLP